MTKLTIELCAKRWLKYCLKFGSIELNDDGNAILHLSIIHTAIICAVVIHTVCMKATKRVTAVVHTGRRQLMLTVIHVFFYAPLKFQEFYE